MTDKPITHAALVAGLQELHDHMRDGFSSAEPSKSLLREAIRILGSNATAQGMVGLPQTITEDMHVAAVKVLHRASGVDGLPQRMLDAMLAAAPAAPIPAVDAVAGEPVANGIVVRSRTLADEVLLALESYSDGGSNKEELAESWSSDLLPRVYDTLNLFAATPPRAGSETTASASVQGVMGAEVVPAAEAAAWKWGYEYLQSRMESIGREGWAHDCDGEIQFRIGATK